jgi:ribosome-associated translation inhibitor RaiA
MFINPADLESSLSGFAMEERGYTMQVPLQVAFEGMQHSDAVESRIREEIERLEEFSGRIVSARVAVTKSQHRHHKGDVYHVRIHLMVPGLPDVAVSREPAAAGAHEDVYVTIRDAFKIARRQLQDGIHKRDGK